jgi:phosphatidylinositol kinase/protein kinase (PI-3  family)
MQLLRDNKDSLMSVLDAFIHDPLVEWEDERRKLVRLHLFFQLLLKKMSRNETAVTKSSNLKIFVCLRRMR